MKRTVEEMKEEAIKRMKKIRLSPSCIRAFEKGEVWLSEGIGALYDLSQNPELVKKLKEFNDEDHLAYHVIHSFTEFGELFSIFYVYSDDEEWDYDNEDLEDGCALVYVWNVDDDLCSEYGSIGFRSSIGGLVRTA